MPALCVSWIDASLLAKDSMYKTTRGVTKEMYFTDDGFPVGIAYCLAILKQVRFHHRCAGCCVSACRFTGVLFCELCTASKHVVCNVGS